MPRTYVQKRPPGYSREEITDAVADVERGASIYQASKERGIPYATLRRHFLGLNSSGRVGAGRSTVLTEEEEGLIARTIIYLARAGFPCDRRDLKDIVGSFASSMGRAAPWETTPGKEWIRGFERRWSDVLRCRKPELLTKARAEGLSAEVINLFFEMYADLVHENHLTPDRIFNLDESGLATDTRCQNVFVSKMDRDTYLRSATCGKLTYSVLFCASACGVFMPPFVVYKGLHLYESWTTGGPDGAAYAVTKSGWMEETVFESWFLKMFLAQVKDMTKPVLLIYDGHGSHLSYNTVHQAIENDVIILCLPPSTSHALQPLDVGLFKPLKTKWRQILKTWSRESRLKSVDKATFPTLLAKLWSELNPAHVMAGFRGSGLYPICPEKVKPRVVETASPSSSPDAEPPSPARAIADAVLGVLSPPPSAAAQSAMTNSKRSRRRVQAKQGEVLTSPEVLKRLQEEKRRREEKGGKEKVTNKRQKKK